MKKDFKQTKIGMIPEDWEVEKLSNHAMKLGSGSTPRGGESVYTSSGIPFIRSQNVNNNKLILEDISYIPPSTHEQMKNTIVYPKDVLLNITGASLGRSCVVPDNFKEGNVNQHVCIIRTKKSVIPFFLHSYLISELGQKFIFQSQAGGNREGLNHDNVKNIPIPLPPLPEQKKIAVILSTWDEAIEKLESLVALKEKRKKGLMQSLLTGKKRLKGFKTKSFQKTKIGMIPEDWESLKLGDVATFQQGEQITSDEQINEFRKGYIRYLYIRDFFTDDFMCYVKDEYPLKKMNVADIMMVNTGNTSGKIYSGKEGVLCNNAFKINYDKNKLTRDYIFQYLNSDITQQKIQRFFNLSGQPHVGHKNVALIPLPVPSFPEQKRIAEVLSAADNEINLHKKEIENIKLQKKGLMQKLLTGKVRVKL